MCVQAVFSRLDLVSYGILAYRSILVYVRRSGNEFADMSVKYQMTFVNIGLFNLVNDELLLGTEEDRK